MTNAQIVGLGVRLFAIWLFVYVLQLAPNLWVFTHRDGDTIMMTMGVITPALLVLVAVALWFFPLTVASKLIPRSALAQSTSLPIEDLQQCGFLLLGLWVLSNAIPSFVRYVFFLYYFLGPHATLDLGTNIPGGMLFSSVQLIIGIWLLFGARGLLGLLRWARRAGT
jgi:hypothetical protein